MTRRMIESLRPLTEAERQELSRVSKASSESVARHRRAVALLAVAAGATFTEGARVAGLKVGDTVAALVRRFNGMGPAALDDHPRTGRKVQYGPAEHERILREFHRQPDPEQDGTGTWSLELLKRALRRAPDGLPAVSTFTILYVLHEAGYTWQRGRTWCETGVVLRKRKEGVVQVKDPQDPEKRGSSSRHTR